MKICPNWWLPFIFIIVVTVSITATASPSSPTRWPLQFHAVILMNTSGDLSLADLWYDWPGGRNLHVITDQLAGRSFYDLEFINGTSFFYYLDEPRTCRSVQLEVGILRPDWLAGAEYLGRETVGGFVCDVWTKVEFIWYYEDVNTGWPVKWVFYTGRTIHVMSFEVGAVQEDAKWQAPVYCFEDNKNNQENKIDTSSISYHAAVEKKLELLPRTLVTSE